MTDYKFYFGYSHVVISAESPRNAVLKFRQIYTLSHWTIWFALPKEHSFICIRDYNLIDDDKVLYFECDIKPMY